MTSIHQTTIAIVIASFGCNSGSSNIDSRTSSNPSASSPVISNFGANSEKIDRASASTGSTKDAATSATLPSQASWPVRPASAAELIGTWTAACGNANPSATYIVNFASPTSLSWTITNYQDTSCSTAAGPSTREAYTYVIGKASTAVPGAIEYDLTFASGEVCYSLMYINANNQLQLGGIDSQGNDCSTAAKRYRILNSLVLYSKDTTSSAQQSQ